MQMLYQDLRSITAKQWKQRTLIDRKNDARRLGMEETEELHDMRLKFKEIFAGLKPATNNSLQERAHLEKLKKGMQNSELKMASIILEKYLAQTNYRCSVCNGQEQLKAYESKEERLQKNNKTSGNRRIQKIQKELKDTRMMVAQIANKIYHRKIRRKATWKE